MLIANDTVVSIDYTLTDDHGAVIDESNADASAETNNAATATLTSTLAPVPSGMGARHVALVCAPPALAEGE